MKIITFFNNKGGVGKTTLATNVASYMGLELGMRVLFLDADPQSNSSQLMLDDDLREEIYGENPKYSTIYDFIMPILMGDSTVDFSKELITKQQTRFNIDIIPGHPSLSLFEDTLSDSWNSCKGRDVGGFRKTNWLLQFENNFTSEYDYLIIDLGPSLGALNRSILLNSNYFISPMGCDMFSLMGIENIAKWIANWEKTYMNSYRDLLTEYKEEQLKNYLINSDCSENYRFAGYSVQQYITKVIKGERRGIKAFDKVKEQIPQYIEKYFKCFFTNSTALSDLDLGYIPNVFSLTPLAQVNFSPIHKLKYSDGIVGNHYNMMESYKNEIEKLVKKLIKNIEEANRV